jgi:hypothetical protein
MEQETGILLFTPSASIPQRRVQEVQSSRFVLSLVVLRTWRSHTHVAGFREIPSVVFQVFA